MPAVKQANVQAGSLHWVRGRQSGLGAGVGVGVGVGREWLPPPAQLQAHHRT